MNAALAWLAREDGLGSWVLFALFVVLPLLARLGRWLLARTGLLQPEVQAPGPADRRQAREAQRQSEQEGEDLWKRLARGEVFEAPPPIHSPRSAPRSEERVEEHSLEEESHEGEAEPEPLSMLGEVSEPGESPEESLEAEAEPAPLEVLTPAALAPPEEPRLPTHRGLGWSRAELRRAIVLAEVLAPPVTERRLRA